MIYLSICVSTLKQTPNTTRILGYIVMFLYLSKYFSLITLFYNIYNLTALNFGHARTSTFRRQQIEGKNPSYFTQTAQVMIQDPNIHFEWNVTFISAWSTWTAGVLWCTHMSTACNKPVLSSFTIWLLEIDSLMLQSSTKVLQQKTHWLPVQQNYKILYYFRMTWSVFHK